MQIAEELEAMQRGLNGLACTSKHEFIAHKYNALGTYQDQLEDLVGEQQAEGIIAKLYQEVIG
jgi:hypothetical protein